MSRLLATIIILLLALPSIGQKRECYCDRNTLMNGATVSCDTTYFSNDSFIYWQYNCDKIWLTLENNQRQKYVIDEVSTDVFNYTYRLGYHLIKEYKTNLLFRTGCSASGPCTYDLINKSDGKKVRDFGQLICIDTDVDVKHPRKYDFNFIVYFETINQITVEYIDSGEKIRIPFKENLKGITPESQFEEMTVDNKSLTLTYRTETKEIKKLTFDIK